MNLHKRLKKLEGSIASKATERPTATEIWYYKLEDTVGSIVERWSGKSEPQEGYDHFFLYAHRDKLKSRDDVQNASDDVLLEALRLSDVKHWGWLQFMVREFNWFLLLATNWGLPGMSGEYGGNSGAKVIANVDERRAQAALYFLEVMRERGLDPMAKLRSLADKIGEEYFKTILRERNEWAYYIYTCESNMIRPEALGAAGEVKYSGDYRAQFLTKIREAAARRRKLAKVSYLSKEREKR
jgi:hypothetical protein